MEEWIVYFQYLTAVAATLLGIAFLTFQVRSDIWRLHPLRKTVAVTTLTELAAPMFFGLFFLMPHHPWLWGGRIVGAVGYIVMVWHLIEYIRHREVADSFDRKQLAGISITIVTFSLLLWWPNIAVKAYTALWMVFSGSTEAWIFLRAPGPVSSTRVITDKP